MSWGNEEIFYQELPTIVVLAREERQGRNWISANTIVWAYNNTNKKILAKCEFDSNEWFWFEVITEQSRIKGKRDYHGFVIADPRIYPSGYMQQLIDEARWAMRSPFLAQTNRIFPDPIGRPQYDRLDLRGRWITPDPAEHLRCDDNDGVPDEPAWLAPSERVRRWCGQVLRARRRITCGDLGGGSLDDDDTLAWLQRSSERERSEVLGSVRSLRGTGPGGLPVSPGLGPAQSTRQAPHDPQRGYRGGSELRRAVGLFDRLD